MPNSSFKLDLIEPNWQAPDTICAYSTTRTGGISEDGYNSLNLASHVNDRREHVDENRFRLKQFLGFETEPEWLQQTHSTTVINLDAEHSRDGDASFTAEPGKVAVVLTADCLPVLFCNHQGSEVAAAHAGWRGLLNGVLEQTVSQMNSKAEELLAWMGPAIGPLQFEVGKEVRQFFIQLTAENNAFFTQSGPDAYLADLYSIARLRLNQLGVEQVSGGDRCTYSEMDCFFSYRREKDSGRQASMIYINKKTSESC